MSKNVPYRRIASYKSQAPNEDLVDGVNRALGSVFDSFSPGGLNLQTDTNIEIKTIDVTVPSPWIQVSSFANAWVNFGGAAPNAQYMRRYDGTVQLRGVVATGVIGAAAFVLPPELVPHTAIQLASTSNGAFAQITITTAGAVIPNIGSNLSFSLACSFMPANNRSTPLDCYPINVKTRFQRPPAAVLAIKNTRIGQDGLWSPNVALMPSWRFIRSNGKPTVQIIDIPGLEHGTRQKVDIMIIGGK